MTKIEALKELFKINLEKLKRYIYIDGLSIVFNEDSFIVMNDDKVVFKNKLSNYDLTYYGQIKFILNIIENIAPIAMIWEELRSVDECFLDNCIFTDIENFIEIEGEGYINDPFYTIEIDLKRFSLSNNKKICDIYKKYKNELLSRKYELKEGLKKDSFKIYLYADDKQHRLIIYIDKKMQDSLMCMGFVKDLKKFEDTNNPENLIVNNVRCTLDYEIITLFYTLTTDKELEEAYEIVQKNLEKISKEFAEKLKRNEI